VKKGAGLGAAAALALALAAGTAVAGDVYVNGVKVTGALKNVDLDASKVSFDAQGDIRITAPGYKVEVEGPAQAPPVAPAQRVWLVVNVPAPGHYKTGVQVNGQALVEIPAESQQYVKEITDGLHPGANGVLFTFYPQPNAPAGAPVDALDILVGEGNKAPDGTLTISRVLGTVKRKTGQPSAEAVPLQFDLKPATPAP
jgi:hypothetical protein